MAAENQAFDVNSTLLKHVGMIKPWFPRRAVISVGSYAGEILRKTQNERNNSSLTLFIEKAKEGTYNSKIESSDLLEIDEKANTHYWFDAQQYLAKSEAFDEKLKRKTLDKLETAIIVASTGEGAGSFLLPEISLKLKDRNVDSVGFAFLPSQLQPPDAFFNALWSMATCVGKSITQIIFDRDNLENYVGVDRKGFVLKGDFVFNYLLELVLTKELFVQELRQLANSLNVSTFSVLAATGASLKVHGSLENILNAAAMKPFSTFDLSSVTALYVLVRMPRQLQSKFSRGKIELEINGWFKERANLKSVFVSEPLYVDDGNDRIDVIMFVGGFSLTETAASNGALVKDIVSYAVKNGFIKEKEWRDLIKTLT